MKSETKFQGSKETLRKIIVGMAYKYRKCESNRKVLMERHDVVARGARYLRSQMHNDGRVVMTRGQWYFSMRAMCIRTTLCQSTGKVQMKKES